MAITTVPHPHWPAISARSLWHLPAECGVGTRESSVLVFVSNPHVAALLKRTIKTAKKTHTQPSWRWRPLWALSSRQLTGDLDAWARHGPGQHRDFGCLCSHLHLLRRNLWVCKSPRPFYPGRHHPLPRLGVRRRHARPCCVT
jgi:hypothetical protein